MVFEVVMAAFEVVTAVFEVVTAVFEVATVVFEVGELRQLQRSGLNNLQKIVTSKWNTEQHTYQQKPNTHTYL